MTAEGVIREIRDARTLRYGGRVVAIAPTYFEADGPAAPLSALCTIETDRAEVPLLAQIISLQTRSVRLAAVSTGAAVRVGARVTAQDHSGLTGVGDVFAGRAVDGLGQPIDALGPLTPDAWRDAATDSATPLERCSPRRLLATGVVVIDTLLTLDHGQRIGVFAAAGVGKTTLLTQLVNQTAADRYVVCLVGERGREVADFWNRSVDPKVRARAVLVASTSDQTAAMRVRACDQALALAEHWRAEGRSVLFVLDSVTRLAMALREMGLAAGEPATVRAYTPSVFSVLPRIVERCGAIQGGGAITAVFTVLSETDDVDDPISEIMKSLLDGHIVLSRTLAEEGRFPAIDVPRSLSRLATGVMSPDHRAAAEKARTVLSVYEEARTLIETGLYAKGADPEIDRAVRLRPRLTAFFKQGPTEALTLEAATLGLSRLLEEDRHAA